MSLSDVSLLLAAMGTSFLWAAGLGHFSGDRRADVAILGGAGVLLAGTAGVLAAI